MKIVNPARLSARRTYPGFLYPRNTVFGGNIGREVEKTGREWRDIIEREKLTLKNYGDGSLGLFRKAELLAEVYEDSQ